MAAKRSTRQRSPKQRSPKQRSPKQRSTTPRSAKRGASRGPLTHVARSAIHGRGLFAARDIPARTRIGVLEGVPARRDGPWVLWMENGDGRLVGLRGTNDIRYVNHGLRPNACYYGPELWSLRRIRAGEEITHDYSLGKGDWAPRTWRRSSTTSPAPRTSRTSRNTATARNSRGARDARAGAAPASAGVTQTPRRSRTR